MVETAKRRAIRTDFPYIARHLDWYIDSEHLTDEQAYYRLHARPGITSWSLETLPLNVVQDIDLVKSGMRMIPLPPKG